MTDRISLRFVSSQQPASTSLANANSPAARALRAISVCARFRQSSNAADICEFSIINSLCDDLSETVTLSLEDIFAAEGCALSSRVLNHIAICGPELLRSENNKISILSADGMSRADGGNDLHHSVLD